jgi:hypothetical protein
VEIREQRFALQRKGTFSQFAITVRGRCFETSPPPTGSHRINMPVVALISLVSMLRYNRGGSHPERTLNLISRKRNLKVGSYYDASNGKEEGTSTIDNG